jgi:5-formyltetrahydrofolate cyclo-ligase
MTKKEARKHFKKKREALTPTSIEDLSLAIANQALQLSWLWEFATYHLFLPIAHKKEVHTDYVLHILQGKDKNIVVSKSYFEDLRMEHFLLTEQTKLRLNKWGIPEPENGLKIDEKQLDVVFVPLLGADKNGNRVGYGKGFYDRFLAQCKTDVLKVGLSFFSPLNVSFEGVESSDIPLDYLITPEEITTF